MYIFKLFLLLVFMFPSTLFSVDYTKKTEVKRFISKMHKNFNHNKLYLNRLFKSIRKNPKISVESKEPKIKKNISKKHRPQGEWDIYSRIHLEHNQTNLGVQFMSKYKDALNKAYKKYGVPPEYITAIIGIESYYGKNRGRFHVLDSLTHLAFGNHRRKKFYAYQLQEFLRMCRKEQVEPRKVKGSKSGAIGMAQFMPSNYKSLAVDFDNDGKIRISKPIDAIGSIANYLKESGWRKGEPVGTRVSYVGNRFYGLKTGFKYKYHRRNLIKIKPIEPFNYHKKVMLIKLKKEKYDELWYGAKNFYVITRYNHSDYYAMAVHQLAQKIKKGYRIAKAKAQKRVYLVKK